MNFERCVSVCMHFFCMCVCPCICVACVCVCLSPGMSQRVYDGKHTPHFESNQSLVITVLSQISLALTPHYKYLCSPSKFVFLVFFFPISRRKKMFATSSRLSDVALYFVHSCRPHNSGRWILKNILRARRERAVLKF